MTALNVLPPPVCSRVELGERAWDNVQLCAQLSIRVLIEKKKSIKLFTNKNNVLVQSIITGVFYLEKLLFTSTQVAPNTSLT